MRSHSLGIERVVIGRHLPTIDRDRMTTQDEVLVGIPKDLLWTIFDDLLDIQQYDARIMRICRSNCHVMTTVRGRLAEPQAI